MKRILSLLFCLLASSAYGQHLDGLPVQGTGRTPAMNSTSILQLCVGSTTTGVPGRCTPARTTIGGLFTTPVSPMTLYSWTTATRPASPAAGMMGWNTDYPTIEVWSGTVWQTPSAFLGGNVPNATNFQAAGTGLTVNHNARVSGNLTVIGTLSSSGGGTFGGNWSGALNLTGAGTALTVPNNASLGSLTAGSVGTGTINVSAGGGLGGVFSASGWPVSCAGLADGTLWNDGGTVKICSGGGGPFSITNILLSTTNFVPPAAYTASAGITLSNGGPTDPSMISLSTTLGGCTPVNGADNGSFSFTPGSWTLNGPAAPGTYQVCLLASVPGASNTPWGKPFTITGAPPGPCSNMLDFTDGCNSQYLFTGVL